MVKTKNQTLTIENYLDLRHDKNFHDLTLNQLKQIIGMHGFRKTKDLKNNFIDAVSTMELMDLCRSTLQSGVVSGVDASVTMNEVIKDLKHLNWVECHVTSIITQGGAVDSSSSSEICHGGVLVKRKRSKIAKMKLITGDLVDGRKFSKTKSTVSVVSTGTAMAKTKKAKGEKLLALCAA